MSKFCVATMKSSHGWETKSPEEAISLHLTYWFTGRRSQGRIFGDVPSFYSLWQKYGDQQDRFIEECNQALESYFKELFSDTTILVSYKNNPNSTTKYNLIIQGKFIVDGIGYDLARSVEVTEGYYKLLDEERLSNG